MRELEELAAREWPATVIEDLDGWDLRWSEATTNRTNSVRPRHDRGATRLADKIAAVERFYGQKKRPTLYQISLVAEPRDLDSQLELRGYERHDPSHLQTAQLDTVLNSIRMSPDTRIEVADELSLRWCEYWVDFAESTESTALEMVDILRLVGSPTLFVRLEVGANTVAVGRGVCDGSWLGVFNMATSAPARGRGAGATVLGALARWADRLGATRAYLQVDEDNQAARSLYRRVGFTTDHEYWYRLRR